MDGLVVKNTGKEYWVRTPDGEIKICTIRGNFRVKGIKSTNPIAVGDYVSFDVNGFILSIGERKNYIVRKPTNLSKQLHIIATNLDQVLLLVTVKNPEIQTAFIDRFLTMSEAYGVPTIILFNKVDLLEGDDLDYMEALCRLYETIGYTCLRISALEKKDIEQLHPFLKGKITLLSGNSGVGKSTLINAFMVDNVARTAEISNYHHKGMHTTTFSEMYPIADGYVIDTPGIKGFGTVDLTQTDVGHYFKDIAKFSVKCKFHNCTHTHEPECAVVKAVDEHLISQSRYQSYLGILQDLNEGKYR